MVFVVRKRTQKRIEGTRESEWLRWPSFLLLGRNATGSARPSFSLLSGQANALRLGRMTPGMGGNRKMEKIKPALLGLIFAVLIGQAPWLRAGDIVGTVTVPKPDQVVVYVETVAGTFAAAHATMDQLKKVFVPFVLPVVKGSTVDFRNGDNLSHNVFGVGADEFNLGAFSMGGVRQHTFNKPGEVNILCNVHPEMEAHVLVLQNPYFARPESNGKFQIAGVPPGDYVIKAWYAGKTKKQSANVPATGSVTVTF
jgi:plastocyanin